MSEWLKEVVCKTAGRKSYVGSNPTSPTNASVMESVYIQNLKFCALKACGFKSRRSYQGERRMIELQEDILAKILSLTKDCKSDSEIINVSKRIIAEHLNVSGELVVWRSFKKDGWHVDPPGRFFVDGKALKLKPILSLENEE